MADRELIAYTLLAAGEVAHAFSAHVPDRYTVHQALQAEGDDLAQRVSAIREGYQPALTFGLGLAAIVAVLARSWLPLAAGGATAALMVAQYEQALPAELRLGGRSAG